MSPTESLVDTFKGTKFCHPITGEGANRVNGTEGFAPASKKAATGVFDMSVEKRGCQHQQHSATRNFV
jgi:hypothetical protein